MSIPNKFLPYKNFSENINIFFQTKLKTIIPLPVLYPMWVKSHAHLSYIYKTHVALHYRATRNELPYSLVR